MTGGIFLDQNNLLYTLATFSWIGKNQNATNEPIAYQLAQVVSTLEEMVEQDPKRWLSDSDGLLDFQLVVNLPRSLGCDCEDCDDECRCLQKHRRCTPLCAKHYTKCSMPLSCMLEMQNMENHADSNNSKDRDKEYTE